MAKERGHYRVVYEPWCESWQVRYIEWYSDQGYWCIPSGYSPCAASAGSLQDLREELQEQLAALDKPHLVEKDMGKRHVFLEPDGAEFHGYEDA